MKHNLPDDKDESLKMITDIINVLEKNRKPSNQFLITGFCLERGMIQIDVINSQFCSNDKCELCYPFRKAFINYAKNWADKILDKIKKDYETK